MAVRTDHQEFLRVTMGAIDLVYNLARRFAERPEDAEDIVQETYLAAYRAWSDGRRPRRVEPWIATICLNVGRTRNNLVCKRTPAANAAAEITDPTACKNDARSTRFTYNNDPPFQMLTEKHPAPNSNGTGARVLDTYQYDADTNGQNFNGLWVEKFGNKDMAGVPAEEGVWFGVDQTWGAGAPPGVPGDGDNWSLRWSGYLNLTSWSAADRAAFRVTTFDEGVTLIVGNTGLLDCAGTTQPQGTYNCGTSQDVTKKLWPGLRPITIEYADLTGNASFKLEWDQGTNNWQTIPDFKFQSNLGLVVFKTTNDATRDILKTHYVFDTDDAKARRLPSRVSVKDLITTEARKTDYTYNQYGQVTTVTTAAETALAATTTNTYTNNSTTSCLTQVSDPTAAVTNYTCNLAGDVTTSTQVVRAVANQGTQNRVTTTEYDSLGRVTKVTEPSSGYTITTYDRAGRPVNLDRYLGTGAGHDAHAYTDYVYDDAGHLTDETLPAVPDPANPGQNIRPTVHHEFDWLDDETSRTDVRGKVWQTAYDALRRVVQTTSPSQLVTRTEYRLSTAPSGGSYQNQVTTYTPPGDPLQPGTVATVTTFNILGRKASAKVGTLPATVFFNDAFGNVTLVIDPAGVRTTYAYNAFNQVTRRTDFQNTGSAVDTTYAFDAAGRLRTVDGPRTDVNDSLTYDYDLANRLTVVTQNGLILPGTPDTPVATTYVWDDASERVRVTQPMSSTQNVVRNWTYDTSARLASYADAKGTTTYSYGAGDQLESVADPRNLTRKFEYDNLSRRTRRYALSGGNTIDDQTFTYDLAGNMLTAKVVASGTTITMDYDNDGRPSHVYQASYPTPTTTYTYSPSTGRLTSVVDPAGTTTYDYDANGHLFHLTDPFNSSSQVTYGYDSAGRLSSRTDPAGLTWTRTYESGTGRLDTQTIRKAGTTLGSFNLGYDQASNVTSRLETVKTETGPDNADSGTWTFQYDAANRMTSSTAPAPSNTVTTYGYDGAGNRTSVKVGTGNPVTTSYDLAGLPTSSSDNTSYTHDAIGELTKIDKPGGTANDWNLVYSSWGVLKTAAHKATGTPDVAYTTDALDRVLSRVAGSTTAYTYRGTGEDAAKAQVGAATPIYYAFTPGGPLAQRTGTDAATLRYFVKDLHGDVVGLAATTGTNPMKGSILYSPWGVPGTKTGELATFPAQGHLGFQGQLTDAMTGQVDMLTRYYEPSLGRFTKRDVLFGEPTKPTSLNQYLYGADGPVTFTDPTGMMMLDGGGGGGYCDRACKAEVAAEVISQGPAYSVSSDCRFCDGHQTAAVYVFPIPIRPEAGIVKGGLFIKDKAIENPLPGGILFGAQPDLLGDYRGFNTRADANDYRAFIRLNYRTGIGRIQINPTCPEGERCQSALAIGSGNEISTRISAGGAVTIEFHLRNSVTGGGLFGKLVQPAIDGSISLGVGDSGTVRLTHMTREDFPSLELYQWRRRTPTKIITEPEGSPYSLSTGALSPHSDPPELVYVPGL